LEKQTSAKSNYRLLNASAFISAVIAFLAAIWIIVPAPSYSVWLFSVAASEWSFALAALAVFGVLVSLIFGGGKLKFASILLGAIALSMSLYPFASAFSAARKYDVSLSLQQYATR
jgi:hypothetical protein